MAMDLLTQAKEDLRREQLMSRFNTFFPWALGAVTVIIVTVGGYEAYKAISDWQNRKQTDAYVAASESSALQPLLDYAKEEGNTHGAFAALTAFARMSPAEQGKDGLPLLRETAKNDKLPDEWRALAALVLVKAEIAYGAGADKADEFLALLKPATDDAKNPWHNVSSIEAALIAGEMKGDDKAAAAFVDMDTSKLSPQLADRVTVLQGHYGVTAKTEGKK